MSPFRLLRLLFLTITCFQAGCASAAPTTQAAADAALSVVDVSGTAHRPLELKQAKAAVFIFVGVDCPIANSYAPEINRICQEYESANPAGMNFYVVYSDPDLSAEAAAKHAREFGYTCPALLDTHQALARRLGATITPEAVVVDRTGEVVYRGRIDDRWIAFGKYRNEPTRRDLRIALDDLLAARPVAIRQTRAIGCSISRG